MRDGRPSSSLNLYSTYGFIGNCYKYYEFFYCGVVEGTLNKILTSFILVEILKSYCISSYVFGHQNLFLYKNETFCGKKNTKTNLEIA